MGAVESFARASLKPLSTCERNFGPFEMGLGVMECEPNCQHQRGPRPQETGQKGADFTISIFSPEKVTRIWRASMHINRPICDLV